MRYALRSLDETLVRIESFPRCRKISYYESETVLPTEAVPES